MTRNTKPNKNLTYAIILWVASFWLFCILSDCAGLDASVKDSPSLNCSLGKIKYANEEIAKHVVEKTFKERKEKGEFTGKYRKRSIKTEDSQNVLELFDNVKS